eukprot:TRINITY_DN18526_c0_g3_i1.p2 TRINITY_DN18526_c0_g3~~TRINITY_DN18526_c0_g3_i1.p2  ORF type:complete len:220 (+),score=45.98 TRINITY_DN18526_c0_g3_i1:192-851(+)
MGIACCRSTSLEATIEYDEGTAGGDGVLDDAKAAATWASMSTSASAASPMRLGGSTEKAPSPDVPTEPTSAAAAAADGHADGGAARDGDVRGEAQSDEKQKEEQEELVSNSGSSLPCGIRRMRLRGSGRDAPLGLTVRAIKSREWGSWVLKVVRLKENGMAIDWNIAHPENPVRVNDLLVSVNMRTGDNEQDLFEAIKLGEGRLDILIRPALPTLLVSH